MKKHYLGATYELDQKNMNHLIAQLDEAKAKLNNILKYCAPYTEQMWAANIASIILECDFRDVSYELKIKGNL